jgi:hypothetical protein
MSAAVTGQGFGIWDNISTNSRLTVQPGGNVGIGTTAPNNKLVVSYNGITGNSNVGTTLVSPVQTTSNALEVRNYDGNIIADFGQTASGVANQISSFYGSVGIGTASPSYPVDIQVGTNETALNLNGSANGFGIRFNVNKAYIGTGGSNGAAVNDLTNAADLGLSSGVGGVLALGYGSGIEAMRIDTSGRVGIGTTTPGYQLQLENATNATMSLSSGVAGVNRIWWISAFKEAGADADFRIGTGPAYNWPYFTILPAPGNVGIGITGPSAALEVSRDPGSSWGNAQLILDNPTGGSGSRVGLHFSGHQVADGDISFLTSNVATTRHLSLSAGHAESDLIIDGNGSVGIGTTAPEWAGTSTGLAVDGAPIAGNMDKAGLGGAVSGLTGYPGMIGVIGRSDAIANTSGIQFGDDHNGNSLQFAIVNGATSSGTSQGNLFFLISNAVNTNPLSSGFAAMTLNRNGYLGIGTSPSFILDVEAGSANGATLANFDSTTSGTSGSGIRISNSGTTQGWIGNGQFATYTTGLTDIGITARGVLALDSNGAHATPALLIDTTGNIHASGSIFPANQTTYGLVGGDAYFDTVNTGGTGDPLELNYRRAGPVKICASVNCATVSAFFGTNGLVGIDTASPGYALDVEGTAYAVGAAGALSDRRHKKDITPLALDALGIVGKLKPVTFLWKEPKDDGMKGRQLGFIAQDVQRIVPDIVLTKNNKEKTLGLKYDDFIPILTKAIQQLDKKFTAQTDEVSALKAGNDNEDAEIKQLKAANDNLRALVLTEGREIVELKSQVGNLIQETEQDSEGASERRKRF